MKGFTNNIHGRPKGIPNKLTSELRSMLHDFLMEEFETVKKEFRLLEPKNRLIFYERLLQYCIPKNTKVGLDTDEAKIEQPLFFETVHCYELDLDKIHYSELKEMIEKSEVFMSSKQDTKVRIELPYNHREQ